MTTNRLFTENEIEILTAFVTTTDDRPLILTDVSNEFPTPTSRTAEIDVFTAMKLETL